MFWKRKPASQARPSAAQQATDPELEALKAALAERQERVAALQLDLFQSRAELAVFSVELEQRLGSLQSELESLEQQIKQERQRADRRGQWGQRADDDHLHEDVAAQYARRWAAPDQAEAQTQPPPRAGRPPDPGTQAELRFLYRQLARRWHPDLATAPAEKAARAEAMARVNAAYAAGDLAALRKMAAEPGPAETADARPRQQLLADLRAEIKRLDDLAAQLELEIDTLSQSAAVQLKLEAMFARRTGRDLLAEMAQDLRQHIEQAETELRGL